LIRWIALGVPKRCGDTITAFEKIPRKRNIRRAAPV
jgi:hypothetical protein